MIEYASDTQHATCNGHPESQASFVVLASLANLANTLVQQLTPSTICVIQPEDEKESVCQCRPKPLSCKLPKVLAVGAGA
eukprot:6209281-Pleurochrysis_carterae.AAC.2